MLFHRNVSVCRRKWMFFCVLGVNKEFHHISLPKSAAHICSQLLLWVHHVVQMVLGLAHAGDFSNPGAFVPAHFSRSISTTARSHCYNCCWSVSRVGALQPGIPSDRDYLAFWSVCPYYRRTSLLSIPCYHPSFCMSLLHAVFYYLISITQFLHYFSCTI